MLLKLINEALYEFKRAAEWAREEVGYASNPTDKRLAEEDAELLSNVIILMKSGDFKAAEKAFYEMPGATQNWVEDEGIMALQKLAATRGK
jgi:hypothetical protein